MPFRLSVVLDRIRHPEYTGNDRCLPCTVLNLLLTAVVAGAVARVSIIAGGICLAVFLLLIYLRGYLVPGTPRLTARYFPAWVLRAFDKRPPRTDTADGAFTPERLNTAENDSDIDPKTILESAGVIESDSSQNDPSLSSSFDAQWHSRIEEITGEPELQRQELKRVLSLSKTSFEFIDTEEGIIVDADGTWIGTWPSRTSLTADIAAEPLLADAVSGWSDFDAGSRGMILRGLRSFIESCPTCSGRISRDTEHRSISCCQSVKYGRYRCDACGATLIEQEMKTPPTGA